jgi:hypothetical protein
MIAVYRFAIPIPAFTGVFLHIFADNHARLNGGGSPGARRRWAVARQNGRPRR